MGMFNCKNVLSQSDCRISQKYLKNNWRYKVGILHAGTYLLKLQIDDVFAEHLWRPDSVRCTKY